MKTESDRSAKSASGACSALSSLLNKKRVGHWRLMSGRLPLYQLAGEENLTDEESDIFEAALNDGKFYWSVFKETDISRESGLRVEQFAHELTYGSVDDWTGENNAFACYLIYRISEQTGNIAADLCCTPQDTAGAEFTVLSDSVPRGLPYSPFLENFLSTADISAHITISEDFAPSGTPGAARSHIAIARNPFGLSGWYAVSYLYYNEEDKDNYFSFDFV